MRHPDKGGAEQYSRLAIWLGTVRQIHSDDAPLKSIQGAAGLAQINKMHTWEAETRMQHNSGKDHRVAED